MIEFVGADLFCGAGGFTTGAMRAVKTLGAGMRMAAVNHWPMAIETHKANHPEVDHYIEDVTIADPVRLVPGGYLDILLASPECTYYSNARGGKPVHNQKRMDPWAVIRWLTHLNVRCLLVENVPEFRDWGPLCTLSHAHHGDHGVGFHGEGDPASCGKRIPQRKGDYFQAWVLAMQRCGYLVEWRILNAADYGDATTRVRFFLQARKDGTAIRWPEPSHARGGADAMFGNRKRWRAAREVIDWTKPGRSVFDDPKYIRQPLSSKTLARTVRGLQRLGNPFWRQYAAALDIEVDGDVEPPAGMPAPFLLGKQNNDTVRSVEQPVMTVTADSGPMLVEPTAFLMGKQSSPAIRDVDEPMMTVTTESAPHLVEPSAEMVGANRNHNVPRDVQEPVPPATTAPGGGLYFVEAVAVPFVLGQQSGSVARDTDEPLPTIAAAGAISLAEPLLIPYYRTGVAKSVDVPMEAITTKGRFGLATPMVVPYGPSAEARGIDLPMPTILSKDRLGIADAFIVPKFGEREGQEPRFHPIDKPLPTVTGDGAGRLVEPALVQVNHGGDDDRRCSVDEPMTSPTTHRNVGLAEPMLLQMAPRHGDINGARSLDDPTYTIVANARLGLFEPALEEVRAGRLDPRRLVIVDGELRVLELRFRMLMNRELARAMSFDDDETTYEFVGNVGEVTKQIGNAVPVRTAKALVLTILEDCLPAEGTEL